MTVLYREQDYYINEYENYINLDEFVSKIDDAILAPRLDFKEEARQLAEAFAMELKIYIQNNYSGITVQSQKYLEKKLAVVGHTMPLILTYQYVNSIKVFEDKTGAAVPYSEEGKDNSPRFYIDVYGYKSCKGFYVDVEDIWHDPSPFAKPEMHSYLKEKKSQRRLDMNKHENEIMSSSQEEQLAFYRKKLAFDTKSYGKSKKERERVASARKNLIRMRDLKRILEYGQKDKNGNMLFTAHWGPVMDAFEERIGTAQERWRKAGQKFYENRVSARTDVDEKEL